jgi:hypothetical protein
MHRFPGKGERHEMPSCGLAGSLGARRVFFHEIGGSFFWGEEVENNDRCNFCRVGDMNVCVKQPALPWLQFVFFFFYLTRLLSWDDVVRLCIPIPSPNMSRSTTSLRVMISPGSVVVRRLQVGEGGFEAAGEKTSTPERRSTCSSVAKKVGGGVNLSLDLSDE